MTSLACNALRGRTVCHKKGEHNSVPYLAHMSAASAVSLFETHDVAEDQGSDAGVAGIAGGGEESSLGMRLKTAGSDCDCDCDCDCG